MEIIERINQISKNLEKRIKSVSTRQDLEDLRIKLLGRKKGEITSLLKEIPKLPPEEKPRVGNILNQLKKRAEDLLRTKEETLKQEK